MTISDCLCGPSPRQFAHTLDVPIDREPGSIRSFALAWLEASIANPPDRADDTVDLFVRRAA